MSTEPDPDGAADAALGGALIGTLDPLSMIESCARTVSPAALARTTLSLAQQVPRILLGLAPAELPAKDARFADDAFGANVVYRRLAASYALWEREMMAIVDEADVDWRTRERARMVLGALTTAVAPTNTLAGNPAALKAAFTTGGGSLAKGLRNFVTDVVTNRGYPSQIDKSAFEVGRNLAASPGWVVHRTPMFELLHFAPACAEVSGAPLLLLPPPVNKYYFWDLAPGRSLVEHAVARGADVWSIVWRDPREDNGDWGVEAYLAAAHEALDVVREHTGCPDAHVFGDCSGGLLLAMLLAHQAATGERRIRTGTFGVTVLDFGEPGGIGVTASERALGRVRERAERKEVISADEISSTFIWMRPNDLVWRYLVDQWLLGKAPPAFDIMYWNADGQGMPARFAHDMTRISLDNGLMEPGGVTVLDVPLDLAAIDVDTYHVAGQSDHISPWKGCYAGARRMGGEARFVLTPTGHVQSIIYPMGRPRAAYWAGPTPDVEPDAWLTAATRTEDSWWADWVGWLAERGGPARAASRTPGVPDHPVLGPAPGRYVHGE